MNRAILLDAGPLGLITNPKQSLQSAACSVWARARQQGQPTAGDKTIDGDMILAGQERAGRIWAGERSALPDPSARSSLQDDSGTAEAD